MIRRCLALILFLGSAGSFADDTASTPVGTWRVVGDKSGEVEALVAIAEHNGIFEGRIIAVLPRPGVDPKALCELCPGFRKNQPLQGMVILAGLRRDGDEYQGGEILDPDSGEIYRCKLSLSEDQRRLQVRGYIGISLFGRAQTWLRDQ